MAATHAERSSSTKGFLNLWCSHCETAFKAELTAWLSRKPMTCPTCGSRRRLLPWEQIRVFRPDYPSRPEYGRIYSLTRVSYR